MPENPGVAMSENPGALVYGTILVATLLAAESAKRETFGRTAGAVAIAVIVYWLSVSYAIDAGERASERTHFDLRRFAAVAVHELSVVLGAVGPLVTLLICWAAGVSLGTAITAAVWTAVAIIVAGELGLGARSGLRGRELVVQTGVGLALGLLVLALRVLLH